MSGSACRAPGHREGIPPLTRQEQLTSNWRAWPTHGHANRVSGGPAVRQVMLGALPELDDPQGHTLTPRIARPGLTGARADLGWRTAFDTSSLVRRIRSSRRGPPDNPSSETARQAKPGASSSPVTFRSRDPGDFECSSGSSRSPRSRHEPHAHLTTYLVHHHRSTPDRTAAAPRSPSATAQARPIQDPAPVMRTTFPGPSPSVSGSLLAVLAQGRYLPSLHDTQPFDGAPGRVPAACHDVSELRMPRRRPAER